MSGIAMAAPTIPGRVATSATCSTARSSTALLNRLSEAKTRPGTRMPSTYPCGISHRKSSSRRKLPLVAFIWFLARAASDVEENSCEPSLVVLFDAQLVIGDCLDLYALRVDSCKRPHGDGAPRGVWRNGLELHSSDRYPSGVLDVEHLRQPVHEHSGQIRGLDGDRDVPALSRVPRSRYLEHPNRRLPEDLVEGPPPGE